MASMDDEEPGFWPGYVAAISGLVQGLLIMAMALGTAIFVLGQLAKVQAKAEAQNTAPRHDPAGLVPQGPPAPTLLAPLPPAGQGGLAPEAPDQVGGPAQISAGFQGDAVVLPGSAVPDVLASFDRARAAGVKRWRISIPADLNDPRDQRAAYLRLLGLRALLIQHGAQAGDIDTWIESSAAASGETRVARIEPADVSGKSFGSAFDPIAASGERP